MLVFWVFVSRILEATNLEDKEVVCFKLPPPLSIPISFWMVEVVLEMEFQRGKEYL